MTASTGAATGTPSVEERWNEVNFAKMAALFRFSQEQQLQMRELQTMLADIHHWKNDPFEVARFLIDFGHEPTPKIAERFRTMVEWRIRENMDTFCERYGTPPPEFQYMPLFLLRDLDKDGDPIYVMRVGAFDAWGMYQRLGADAIVEYNKFTQEVTTTPTMQGAPKHWNWQADYQAKTGHRLGQTTMIVDVEGLSTRNMKRAMLGFVQRISRIGQDYYPGYVKRIIVLRAPRIFQMGWKLVKNFYDPQIQALITITSASDYLEVCDQYMDRSVLPACMCPGEGQGQPMPGYFESVKMEAGPLPTHVEPCNRVFLSRETVSLSDSDTDDDVPPPAVKSMSLFKGHMDLAHGVIVRG